ncbi:XdhC family protein [Anaerosolibacter sp.]|uniref:XdhC family protein n=1 Tax=Anaerosolibacter sp. TaxID=1872527 RepID=UPI0039EE4932
MFENAYRGLLGELILGKEAVLLTFMKPKEHKAGDILNKLLVTKDNLTDDFFSNNQELSSEILHAFTSGNLILSNAQKETVLIEPYFPKPRLVILGGGHIAKPLCEFGVKVGFDVTVVDDRPSFANANRFPEASEIICESFERCFELIKPRKSDFFVIVTRGHRHDGVCLRNILGYTSAYIGMIGSKRRVRGMKDELLKEGYSKDQLDSINAPIGLDIGAVTPEEIAVSIIAQVIKFRRIRDNTWDNEVNTKFNWPECDSEVIKDMSKEAEILRALATIISSKGSVPRKAGAKMIVWQDGRVMGSIGGGCSEASVIALARDIMLSKGYTIAHVDMTGNVAEEEGMVCGGTMEVLIESF